MLVVANFANLNDEKKLKMTETLAHGCSFESTQRELSKEYQYDRVKIVLKIICVLALRRRAASALER